jgi:hypothetical protein
MLRYTHKLRIIMDWSREGMIGYDICVALFQHAENVIKFNLADTNWVGPFMVHHPALPHLVLTGSQ